MKITSAEGIGFAIPINVIKNVIKSYEETDSFEEATLGIYAYDGTAVQYLDDSTTNTATQSAVMSTNVTKKGIYVDQITANGPASKTDLKKNDIINKIDDKELTTVNDLREYIFTKKPNDQVKLEISRGKITREIQVTLGKKQ